MQLSCIILTLAFAAPLLAVHNVDMIADLVVEGVHLDWTSEDPLIVVDLVEGVLDMMTPSEIREYYLMKYLIAKRVTLTPTWFLSLQRDESSNPTLFRPFRRAISDFLSELRQEQEVFMEALLQTQRRRFIIMGVLALGATASSLGWAIHNNTVWAWELFTNAAILSSVLIAGIPFLIARKQFQPQGDIQELIWGHLVK